MRGELKRVLRGMRDAVRYRVAKAWYDRELPEPPLPIRASSVLFIRTDAKIGDAVISSFVFRELKRDLPQLRIGVLASAQSVSVFERNPFVDAVHAFPKRPSLRRIGGLCRSLPRYEAVVLLAERLRPRDMKLLQSLGATINVGSDERIGMINVPVSRFVEAVHHSDTFVGVARAFGVEVTDRSYLYEPDHDAVEHVAAFLSRIDKPYIALNGFGAAASKCFSRDRLESVVRLLRERYPEYAVVVLTAPPTDATVREVVERLGDRDVHFLANADRIDHAAAQIARAELLVSVDTGTVHLANALNRPLVAIYREPGPFTDTWGPHYDRAVTVFCRPPRNPLEEVNLGEFDDHDLLAAVASQLGDVYENGVSGTP